MATTPVVAPPEEATQPAKKSICKVCGLTFDSPQLLSAHKRMRHPGGPPQGHTKSAKSHPFRCKQCSARFAAPTALGAHMRKVHGVLGKSPSAVAMRKLKKNPVGRPATTNLLQCPQCKQRFRNALMLGSHRFTMHGVRGTSVTAKYMQDHKGPAAPPCEICGHVFTSNHGVSAHMRAHTRRGEFPSGQSIPRRTLNNGNSAGNTNEANEVAIAFWISQGVAEFKATCSDIAKRVELLPEDVASRILAVVQRSSKEIRARYRLSD